MVEIVRMSAKMIRIAANLKEAGFVTPKIAEFLELSPQTVASYLAETKAGRKFSSATERVAALKMLSEGVSRSEVAQRFGVNIQTITNWKHDANHASSQ